MKPISKLAAVVAAVIASSFSFGQVAVDGVLGSEWSGANVVSVGYNASAPVGNFATPTAENHLVAYDIYTRSDADWIYVMVYMNEANGGSVAAGTGVFGTNLYFDTDPSAGNGSDLGFEVTNNRAFIPGVPGYNTIGLDSSNYKWASNSTSTIGAIEFALSWNYLMTDPGSMGFAPATDSVVLRLSQTFGYSVAGGASYGVDRLGRFEAVPEPGTMIIGALAGVAALRKKFAKKK